MINLKQFNLFNKDDWKLYAKMLEDYDIRNNVNSVFDINTFSFIINNDDNKIGIVKIIPEVENFSIDIGILKDYTNNGYGVETLLHTIDLIELFDEGYNKIIIRTKYNNKSVVECARKLGFIYDIEEIERCMNEGEDYLVLSKYNSKNKTKTMV